MQFIIYLSAATDWFTETELTEILQISNTNNHRDEVTGLLLYNNGNFIQLLEGEEDQLQQTFERISRDKRHKGVTPVASGTLNQRNFPDWSMGFKAVNNDALKDLEGVFDGEKASLLNNTSHLSANILKAFIRTAKMNF